MASFRALAVLSLLGLTAAVGAQSSDLQSLVQKNVGVHAPDGAAAAVNLFRGSLEEEGGLEDLEGLEGSLEVPPKVVLSRLPMEMVDTAKSAVTSIWKSFQRLMDSAQGPFLKILGLEAPAWKDQRPEELMELFTAYLVAFKDTKFPKVVNATIQNVSHNTGSVGNTMAAVGLELITREAGVQTGVKEHAAMKLEHAGFESNRAYAEAATKYFKAMKALTNQLPTQFLLNATKEYRDWLDGAAGAFDGEQTFKESLKPLIKSAFAKDAACATLRAKIPDMGESEKALRSEVSAAISDIRGKTPELDFFAAVVARRRSAKVLAGIPAALASFNYFLDATEESILKFAGGLHVLTKAMLEVATNDLNCTIA